MKLWEQVKELEESRGAPSLEPTVLANPQTIQADLDTHGCAYVVDTPQGFFLAHPNKVAVYGTPKLRRAAAPR